MSDEADGPLELRVLSEDGRERRLRLVGAGGLLGLLVGSALLAGLVGVVALVPQSLARARARRAMDVALERRAQLGNRLRSLVASLERIDGQVRAHAALVDRVRGLYGLPAIDLPEPAGRPGGTRIPGTIFASAVLRAEQVAGAAEQVLSRADSQLAALQSWEVGHRDAVESVPARLPVSTGSAVFVRGFGPSRDPVNGEPEWHAGIDLAAPLGTPLVAPASGVVRWAGEAPSGAGEAWWRLGRIVVLASEDGRYRVLLGHCERILVRTGQRVRRGAPVATVGASGWAAAPRVHVEIRVPSDDGEWVPVDPRGLLLRDPFGPAPRVDAPAEDEGPGTPTPWPRAFRR